MGPLAPRGFTRNTWNGSRPANSYGYRQKIDTINGAQNLASPRAQIPVISIQSRFQLLDRRPAKTKEDKTKNDNMKQYDDMKQRLRLHKHAYDKIVSFGDVIEALPTGQKDVVLYRRRVKRA